VPSSKPNVSMIIDPDMLERIEDFRFEHRFPTRTAAILWLLQWALEQRPEVPREGAQPVHSRH